MKDEGWTRIFAEDPRAWLTESDEPAARWIALTHLLDSDPDNEDVIAAHEAVMADPCTHDLLDRLHPWDEEVPLAGHDKPRFAPNLLSLLADMGVRAEDDERIAGTIECMLEHQDEDGRFQALARWRKMPEAAWGALPCDAHTIAETVARFGRGDDPRAVRAFERIAADVANTEQGRAWPCRPDPVVGFRGPGRKNDICPQVTLEALRAFSYLPPDRRPPEVIAAGRISLAVWRDRRKSKPYMFGHGRNFKRVKWPVTWYGAFEMVDVLGRYPELWVGPGADPADRRSLSEVAACLVAYNVGEDGRVTPRSAFKGFEAHSFGQKKRSSAFATARMATILRRLEPIAEEIAAVDVSALGSSKGGSGTPRPPG